VIRSDDPTEVRRWATLLCVTVEVLRVAIDAVGTDVERVRERLAVMAEPPPRAHAQHLSAAPSRADVHRALADEADGSLARIEERISILTRQIMGMERTLANLDFMGANTASAEEAIGSAYVLLGLYRRRRSALVGR
jgi:hypothetical protein